MTTYRRKLLNSSFISKSGWQDRHRQALLTPREGFEHSIVALIAAWADYADQHAQSYESGIGTDGYAGPVWASVGRSIRTLLNCETGNRLDCGTLDSFIADTLKTEGFDDE